MRVEITMVRPDLEEVVFAFDRPAEVTIGRASNCVCRLEGDAMASRMHAAILVEPPLVHIKDLNSTNGLTLNGAQYGGDGGEMIGRPRELRDGDELIIGKTLFRIRIFGEAGANGATPIREVREPEPRAAAEEDGFAEETVVNHSPPFPEVPGCVINGFIGSGRTGTVYKGVRMDGGENVAVKVLFPDLFLSRQMLEIYLRDIEAMSALNHRNLVRCLGGGALQNKNAYMLAEYVGGRNLAAYAGDFPGRLVPVGAAVEIFRQMCAGLAYAHERGLIHRDLKPRKMLLRGGDGGVAVKVADVGLFRVFEDSGLLPHGAIADVESHAYMAPEVMRDPRDAKFSADVFAVGAVMYEMLAGVAPYAFPTEEEAGSHPRIIPLEERSPRLPEPLLVIIDRCLSPDPEERYWNCGDLLEALDGVPKT